MAHYALQKLHILPSTLMNMPPEERAFIYGSILTRVEAEREEQRKLESKMRK